MTDYKEGVVIDRMAMVKESSKDVLASIVGSAACVYTGQPFDTVKVRMQVLPGEFKSSLECFKKTMMGEGIATLWRGSVPALIGALSENTVAFTINGNLKRLMSVFRKDESVPSSYEPFVSGGLTGFCTAFVLCPSDVLKCRSQLSRSQGISMGFRDILRTTIQKQGIKGLYTGISAQIVRDIPFYASFFGSYDVFCGLFKKHTDWNDTSVYFISGGLAGQVAFTNIHKYIYLDTVICTYIYLYINTCIYIFLPP